MDTLDHLHAIPTSGAGSDNKPHTRIPAVLIRLALSITYTEFSPPCSQLGCHDWSRPVMLMLSLPFCETYWTKPVQYQAIGATILGPRKPFRQQAIFFYVLKKNPRQYRTMRGWEGISRLPEEHSIRILPSHFCIY
jgi:hypothetical protein